MALPAVETRLCAVNGIAGCSDSQEKVMFRSGPVSVHCEGESRVVVAWQVTDTLPTSDAVVHLRSAFGVHQIKEFAGLKHWLSLHLAIPVR